MTEELLRDPKIVSLYKAIVGASATNDLDYEVKNNLLEISSILSSYTFFFLCKIHEVPHETRTK